MIVQAGDMRAMSEALMDALGLSQADVMRQRGPLTNGEQEAISDQRAAFDAKDAEIERLREVLHIIAAQTSGKVCSTERADCMAALAQAALTPNV